MSQNNSKTTSKIHIPDQNIFLSPIY